MVAGKRRGLVPTRGNLFGTTTQARSASALSNETIKIGDDSAMDVDDGGLQLPQSVRGSLREGSQTSYSRPVKEETNPAPKYRPMRAAELMKLQHDSCRRHREDSEQALSEAEEKPPAEYVKFACKWEKCDRILVNLATLRRHIFTLHGKPNDVFTQGKLCMWHGCGNTNYCAENDATPGTYLNNLNLFRQHIEDTHLKSVASLYGDGAKTDVYDNDSNYDSSIHSAFLNDCEGRQVTPSVVDQPVEKSKRSELNNKARVKKSVHERKCKDRIMDFWNIQDFEHQPLKLNDRKSTGGLGKSCTDRFIRAQQQLEEEYGVELAEAAKMNEGLPEGLKKKVYSHDMPEALKEKLMAE